MLYPRSGHNGKLTNRTCIKRSGNDCAIWGVRDYDITDPSIRKELIDFAFVCKLAGKRYKICPDPAGFCRYSYDCNVFQKIFGTCKPDVSIVPIEPYQFFIDSSLRCFSERAFNFDEVK